MSLLNGPLVYLNSTWEKIQVTVPKGARTKLVIQPTLTRYSLHTIIYYFLNWLCWLTPIES